MWWAPCNASSVRGTGGSIRGPHLFGEGDGEGLSNQMAVPGGVAWPGLPGATGPAVCVCVWPLFARGRVPGCPGLFRHLNIARFQRPVGGVPLSLSRRTTVRGPSDGGRFGGQTAVIDGARSRG